jgi:hypothetical protein
MDIIRLVQLFHPEHGRRVAVVKEPNLVLVNENLKSAYTIAMEAIDKGEQISELISSNLSAETLDYPAIYEGRSSWTILPSFDHPDNPSACLVSGTGLTHKSSALNRQMMHQAKQEEKLTDSMTMYQWGLEGGKPAAGEIGIQPEWFYKGNGNSIRAHGQTLAIPSYAEDGGEEPEVAGIYVVDKDGVPWRIGFSNGNEFSDHVMERRNYLYLAPSKLRQSAIGPELVIGLDFGSLEGRVSITRKGKEVWSQQINSGEHNMAHSLANLEHHHFKYESHRIPFQAHIHYFGADAFSFGNQIEIQDGDQSEISWTNLGRPLVNTIAHTSDENKLVHVNELN